MSMIVYKTTNLINGKVYVGQDAHNRPKYLGSGILLMKALKKYGKENFKKDTVAWCDTKDKLDFLEKFYIDFFKSKVPNGYNLTDGGDGFAHGELHPMKRPEVVAKVSKALTGMKRPNQLGDHNVSKRPEVRNLISMFWKGRSRPTQTGENNVSKRPEVREKISKAITGKSRPDLAEYNRKVKSAHLIVKCDYCGKERQKSPSQVNAHNFCSKAHYGLYKIGKEKNLCSHKRLCN